MTSANTGAKATAGLALAAVGVVMGDLGTSPLYAFKETIAVAGTERPAILGVASLIFWVLMLIASVKYLMFVMRADNHGEGGIFALLALLPEKYRTATRGTKMLLFLTILVGAALLFGDGALTPAISVLSATEGLGNINPNLTHYAVPLTVVILIALFAVQPKGTHNIGRMFGPVMVVWFVTLAGFGLYRIAGDVSVLQALSPTYAVSFLFSHLAVASAILSALLLCSTGTEAMYADIGHFGLRPIRFAWGFLVAPSLVLCYLGQAAIVSNDPSTAESPFFSLAPNHTLMIYLVVLSTLATVIASQALITGVFSLSRQAVQLGLFPRLTIRHTNHAHEGQIYVPIANWLLGIASIALVIGFGSSSRLASAYVLAIAGTMAITTIAFYRVTRDVWGWPLKRAVPLAAGFLVIDLAFLGSTITKLFDGGWVPVLLAGVVLTLMLVWRTGQRLLSEHVDSSTLTWEQVGSVLESGTVPRISGEAVVMASHPDHVPQALAASIRLLRSVPERVTVLTLETQSSPTVPDDERLVVSDLGHDIRQVVARVGFAETPSVPDMLLPLSGDPAERVFYLSDRHFLATSAGKMGRLPETLFAVLHRNAARPGAFFGLPDDRVVTLATHIDL